MTCFYQPGSICVPLRVCVSDFGTQCGAGKRTHSSTHQGLYQGTTELHWPATSWVTGTRVWSFNWLWTHWSETPLQQLLPQWCVCVCVWVGVHVWTYMDNSCSCGVQDSRKCWSLCVTLLTLQQQTAAVAFMTSAGHMDGKRGDGFFCQIWLNTSKWGVSCLSINSWRNLLVM